MNTIRRKEFYVLVATIAAAVLLFFLLRPVVQASLAVPRMLRAVGLEQYPGLRRIDYSEWTDPLHYCPGYEIMAFSVDGNHFDVPDCWETSAEPVDLEEFEQWYHTDIYVSEVLALSLGGDDCVAWRFVDHRDELRCL